MPSSTLKADILLLITATIWGFAFVAQRVGMAYIGPFTFTAVRFSLGAAMLFPLALMTYRRSVFVSAVLPNSLNRHLTGGIWAGLALYGGACLQQVGIVSTTAGNAGFITGLYVVLVPLIGLLWGQRTNAGTWCGVVLATAGLYLLSVNEETGIGRGDLIVLVSAVVWALHVHILARVAPGTDPLLLACIQFSVCAVLSWGSAAVLEIIQWSGFVQAAMPILYGGVLSVGIAYTLQVVAQRSAHPAHASILFSLETVFAALGGWLMLDENLSRRALIGCGLMLAAMLISQLYTVLSSRKERTGSSGPMCE